jgi:primosomal protein N' (replication factor Y) (superfamily II helicase)
LGANQPSIRITKGAEPIAGLSFAKVILDSSVPHLDREFDYLIPSELASKVRIGSRVLVPFGRRQILGWVVEKSASSKFNSKISMIKKVVGSSDNFDFNTLRLAKTTAEYFGGNLSDVLRFCAPPRHATIEKSFQSKRKLNYPKFSAQLDEFSAGPALLKRLGVFTKAQLLLDIEADWISTASQLIKTAISEEKNVLIIVPDNLFISQLLESFKTDFSSLFVTKLSADLPANQRFESYLEIINNQTQIVIGTRNAIFAPLKNMGLILVVNEYSDLHTSPQAPYFNVTKVAQFRAEIEQTCLVFLGNSLSIDNYVQIEKNDIKLLQSKSSQTSASKVIFDDGQSELDKSKFSSTIWQAINRCKSGPVLVQVPRRGTAGLLRCTKCYRIANCRNCDGLLRIIDENTGPECSRCARLNLDFKCTACSNPLYKVTQPGQSAILHELGKMFSNSKIISSTGVKRVLSVSNEPSIVVATPQAAPLVEDGGYQSIVILNAQAQFTRPSLNLYQEVFHQWMDLLALLDKSTESQMVVSGEIEPKFAIYLAKNDVLGFIDHEMKMRKELRLPPHRDAVVLKGAKKEVEFFKNEFINQSEVEIFGPVAHYQSDDVYQIALLTNDLVSLVSKVRNLVKTTSAKRKSGIQVQVNPFDFI